MDRRRTAATDRAGRFVDGEGGAACSVVARATPLQGGFVNGVGCMQHIEGRCGETERFR